MKECFLITSYCDTDVKVNVLKDCINNLKQFDIDICLHAHYPLDFEIQNSVNYYLYDNSNPILSYPDSNMLFWRKFNNFNMKIYLPDYGYTVLQQWKRGTDFLKKIGYDNIIILNYDVYLDSFIVNKIREDLNINKLSLFYWDDNTLNLAVCGLNDINLGFITKEDYINKIKLYNFTAELFLDFNFKKISNVKNKHEDYKEHFYTMCSIDNNKYKTSEIPSEEIDGTPWDIYNFQDYKIHIGELNGEVSILVFSIKKDINISIDNYSCEIYKGNYLLYHTKIKWDEFSENDINIIINSEIINKNIVKSFIEKRSKIEKIDD